MWSRFTLALASLFGLTMFALVSAVNLVSGAVLQLLLLPWDPQRRASLWVNRVLWGHALFALEPSFPIAREGLENVGPGPYIVVSNHASALDIPACHGLPLPLRVVGKRALLRVPFLGWYMRFTRQIPLDGGTPESVQAFIDQVQRTLDAGISVLLFPEGTRTADGRVGRFHRGAFRLAKDTGVPVLPVAIEGSGLVLGKGRRSLGAVRRTIHMRVLAPVDPAAFSTARKLSNRVRALIMEQLPEVQEVA